MIRRTSRQLATLVVLAAGSVLAVALTTGPSSASTDPPAPAPSATPGAGSGTPPGPGVPSLSATPRPLSPVSPTVSEVPWLPAPCASGRLESVTGAGGSAIIQAEVTLCGKWTSSYSFTLAVFRPRWERAIVTSGELKHYRPDGPTTASTNIVPPATGAIGVCLMRSESARLACLRLEADGAGGVTATSVPVDDPLVAYPVYYFQDNLPPPGGHCASCVTTGRT